MPVDLYITASCIIDQQDIFRDGSSVFKNTDTDLAGFLTAAYRNTAISYPKFFKMDNLARLGWLAAEYLLRPDFPAGRYRPEEVGLVLTNANASLDADLKYFDSVSNIPSPALFVYTLPNIVIGEICIKHKFKGENAFFIFEVFDAAFLENYVGSLLHQGVLEACICGWVELLGESHKAALYLVEKTPGETTALAFTQENLNQLYQKTNG